MFLTIKFRNSPVGKNAVANQNIFLLYFSLKQIVPGYFDSNVISKIIYNILGVFLDLYVSCIVTNVPF